MGASLRESERNLNNHKVSFQKIIWKLEKQLAETTKELEEKILTKEKDLTTMHANEMEEKKKMYSMEKNVSLHIFGELNNSFSVKRVSPSSRQCSSLLATSNLCTGHYTSSEFSIYFFFFYFPVFKRLESIFYSGAK